MYPVQVRLHPTKHSRLFRQYVHRRRCSCTSEHRSRDRSPKSKPVLTQYSAFMFQCHAPAFRRKFSRRATLGRTKQLMTRKRVILPAASMIISRSIQTAYQTKCAALRPPQIKRELRTMKGNNERRAFWSACRSLVQAGHLPSRVAVLKSQSRYHNIVCIFYHSHMGKVRFFQSSFVANLD